MSDQEFNIITAGASDWDSDLNFNFDQLERGYHITERAGQAVSSGQVLSLNSGGFFFPYNPNSAAIAPHAYAFTAAASGDSLQALAWGIVRSLDINSPAVPGKLAFATASGFLSTATLGLPVGIFTTGRGVLFNPDHAAGGGSGSAVGSLSDVDASGLADGSILKWSNASSKFVMSVDSTGGGGSGSDPRSYFTAVASGGAGWDARFSKGVTITSSNALGQPASSSPYNHMMGQPGKIGGKRYLEFLPGGTGFAAVGLVGPGGHLKNGDGDTIGTKGVGQIGVLPGGQVKASNMPNVSVTVGSVAAWTASVHIGFAVDLDNMLFWVRVNTAGTWNNSASADPTTGVGGIDLTWALAGTDAPMIWPAGNWGDTNTHALYVRSADIGARLPSGYVAWDS